MSVWNKVTCKALEKNVKMEVLEAGLKEMGLGLNKEVNHIKNAFGSDECYAAIVNKNNATTTVGVNLTKDGGLEITGDLWCSGLGIDGGHQELMDTIAKEYQAEHIIHMMQNNPEFSLVSKKRVNDEIVIEIEKLF